MRYTGGYIGNAPNQSQKIEYVGGVANGAIGYIGTPGANLTVNFASTIGNVIEGDLVIVGYASGALVNNNLSLSTTGYTLLSYDYIDAASFDINLLIAYKRMGSVPDTSVIFNPSGSTTAATAFTVQVFRNVDKNIFDVTTTASSSAATQIVDPAAITPITKNALIVCIGASGLNGFTADATFRTPDLFNFISVASIESDADTIIGAGIYNNWVSGAFDPGAWSTTQTPTAGTNSYAAKTIALRPQRPSGVVTLEDIYNIQNH